MMVQNRPLLKHRKRGLCPASCHTAPATVARLPYDGHEHANIVATDCHADPRGSAQNRPAVRGLSAAVYTVAPVRPATAHRCGAIRTSGVAVPERTSH